MVLFCKTIGHVKGEAGFEPCLKQGSQTQVSTSLKAAHCPHQANQGQVNQKQGCLCNIHSRLSVSNVTAMLKVWRSQVAHLDVKNAGSICSVADDRPQHKCGADGHQLKALPLAGFPGCLLRSYLHHQGTTLPLERKCMVDATSKECAPCCWFPSSQGCLLFS